MKMQGWIVVMTALLAAGCGGSKVEATVGTLDNNSLQASPAGAATVAFMDMESMRPDDTVLAAALGNPAPSGSFSSGCRTIATTLDSTTRSISITFHQCPATNGAYMSGTLVCTSPLDRPSELTMVYKLNCLDPTGVRGWDYSGTKQVSVDWLGRTATLTVPTGESLSAVYHDDQSPTLNHTYHYVPDLQATWTLSGQLSLSGSYTFAQEGGVTVSAIISAPLVWTPSCCAPTSGNLELSAEKASAQVVFGPNCGDMYFNGTSMPINCQ